VNIVNGKGSTWLVNWLILSKLVLYLVGDSKWLLPREQMHSKELLRFGEAKWKMSPEQKAQLWLENLMIHYHYRRESGATISY